MSQMTKCDEGHFFDRAQNTNCPFCGVGTIGLTKKAPDGAMEKTYMAKPNPDEDKTLMAGAKHKVSGGAHQGAVDPDATIAVWKKSKGIDPIVGWLVCTQGANQGRDYRIRSGYNSIGRDTSSQICIAGDETISREEHAKIFFDPKNASFHVIAGSGRSGIYVNDQAVLQPTQLKPYDLLELGATKVMFVPFCGENFKWEMES